MIKEIINKIKYVYPKDYNKVYDELNKLINKHQKREKHNWIDEKDIMLITYGDSIKSEQNNPLMTLKNFLDKYTKNTIGNVHLLPMFPYSSDDGFSVIDYKKINPELGSWDDINKLSENYNLMFDAVINHISKESEWFKGYLAGMEEYHNYFVECDINADYSKVVRPRALPLYYPYKSNLGTKYIWATFSEDQVDLNYENYQVLIEVIDILVMYAINGAKFIRLDAIGFLWKKLGTTSIHLKETHLIIQIMRYVLDIIVPGTILVSETNVPHLENISYFGDGHNEAHMVYQFPLPPLTLYSFLYEDATKLSEWAKSLNETKLTDETTYFNFLASHDGIGMRPVEDILTEEEKSYIVDHVIKNGGKINYKTNEDGSKTPYELNINYQDALIKEKDTDETRINKFIAAQSLLLSFVGIPAIYIHSLLGSRNDYEGLRKSGINRRINREKLIYENLEEELNDFKTDRSIIFNKYLNLINIRRNIKAFNPNGKQEILNLDKHLFTMIRTYEDHKVLVVINVSSKLINKKVNYKGKNLINNESVNNDITVKPYEYLWIELS